MNKRGQVFLMAAVIIAGVIIGVSRLDIDIEVGNSNEAFYDLSEEVGFETKRVLDYGVFKEDEKIEDFFLEYKDYIAREQVALVVGNSTEMRVYYFVNSTAGIGINTGGETINSSVVADIQDLENRTTNIDMTTGGVDIKIDSITYNFKMREGQNFFFVMVKHKDDEKFIAKG